MSGTQTYNTQGENRHADGEIGGRRRVGLLRWRLGQPLLDGEENCRPAEHPAKGSTLAPVHLRLERGTHLFLVNICIHLGQRVCTKRPNIM